MQCVCGCGAEIPRKLTGTQLVASSVALELLVWDRTRARALQSATAEGLIARGAECYQRLLVALHGGNGPDPVPESEEWLEESLGERLGRSEMTEKGGFLRPTKLRVTEDEIAQLNRLHPELSFSGDQASAGSWERESADADPAAQLRGLRDLHEAGALTDEEFAAAKARVIARLD